MPTKPDQQKPSPSARKAMSEAAIARVAKSGMPVSPGRTPDAAQLEKTYKHPDLIAGGLARPGKEAQNVLKYGYESVQDHYINGPADLPLVAIARVWNVNYPTLQHWLREYNWHSEREKRLAQTPVLEGGTKPHSAVELARGEFIARESTIVHQMLNEIEARFSQKEEDIMSPTGAIVQVKKRAATLRTEVQTAKMIFEHARMALGMRTKPGVFEGANIDARSVTIINESRPAQAETDAYMDETLKELMPPEGEVVT